MQFYTLFMYSIFYICGGLKLQALGKAVSTTSSRLRTSRKKAAGGEDGTPVEKPEDIKPLIIHKIGLRQGTPEKLVVNVEKLSFRPPSGIKLQTARRGKLFRAGNLHGRGGTRGMCRGGKAAVDDDSSVNVSDTKPDIISDDKVVTDDKMYNEWLVAQGLVGLSDDQPSHGSIGKLHEKVSDDKSQYNVSKSESEKKGSDIVIEDKVVESNNTSS